MGRTKRTIMILSLVFSLVFTMLGLGVAPAVAYTARCSIVEQTWHMGEKPAPYTLANVYVTGRTCVAADGYIDNAHSYLSLSMAKANASPTRWTSRGLVEIVNTRAQEIWRFYGADQWCAYWICSPTELWFFQASLVLLYRGSPPIVTRSLIVCQNSWCGGSGHVATVFWR